MISPANIDAQTLHHLNTILRTELAAVQQHFIHVLTLKAWGESKIADGITAMDEVDLPNAMRIVDVLVSTGARPEPRPDRSDLAEHMPIPGSSHAEILASERLIERKLIDALKAARDHVAETAPLEVQRLISDPLSPRPRYGRWLQLQFAQVPQQSEPARPLPDDAMSGLNVLFAHLLVTITQGLVHAFVHWHGGQRSFADAAWATSGTAMMLATEITNHLALRRTAPAPVPAVLANAVPLPRIGMTSAETQAFDRRLAENVHDAADRATECLQDTEFEPVRRTAAAYFWAMAAAERGANLPEIHNPCADFERVLREYVWRKGIARPATA